jgi:hypothetical protein
MTARHAADHPRHHDLDEKDLDISFVRASGPGGQNVNKLSTAAQLRFDTCKARLADDIADAPCDHCRPAPDQGRGSRACTRSASAPRSATGRMRSTGSLEMLSRGQRAAEAAPRHAPHARLEGAPPRQQEAPRHIKAKVLRGFDDEN